MTARLFGLVLSLCASAVPVAAEVRVLDPSKDIVLANERVQFRFAGSSMGLVEMTDLVTRFEHIPRGGSKNSLWELTFGSGIQRWAVTNAKFPCTRATLEERQDGARRLALEWVDLTWFKEQGALTVRATVELRPGDGVASWRLSVNNASDSWGLWSASFPKVTGLRSGGEYDIARPYFAVGGMLLPKWTAPVKGHYPSGGWSMQVAALSSVKNSLYLAAHDPDAWRKDFEIDPAAGMVQIKHYPEGMAVPGSTFLDPYPVLFGPYQGDWRDAAIRYRGWALQQKWASAGPLVQRSNWSERLSKIGYWVVYDFPLNDPENLPVERLPGLLENARRRLGVDIGVHWYRWHKVVFDNDYPEFLPAKPNFAGLAAEMTKRGFLVMPYINGVSVDRSAKSFPKYLPGAAKDQAGGLYMKYYLDTSGRLLAMCGQDPVWRTTVAGLVKELAMEHGVNGIYIDQISAHPPEFCFDPAHRHPHGGGPYGTSGYRDILRSVQNVARANGRDISITSESQNEVFLDLLDANLTWGTATGFEIPFFDIVYSGYTMSFGSVTPLERSEQFFRRTQGSAVLDGRQLGWLSPAIFETKHESKVEYLRRALAFRKTALQYLVYGQLQQVIAATNGVPSFEAATVLMDQPKTAKFPGAEGRVWRSPDGKIGLLFANYLENEVEFSWEAEATGLGIPPGNYRLIEDGKGTSAVLTSGEKLKRTEKLPPLGFKLIEIVR